jgi:apolipoprotein N-acyltransferase
VLLVAACLLPFANGANTISLAAWLAPVFLLRFIRKQRPALALPIAYIVLTAAFAFQFRSMVPIPGAGLILFTVVYGFLQLLPYLIDRLFTRMHSTLADSLVFPCALVAVDYAISLGPFASWGSPAYSQFGNLALLQVLAVTGMWGITFLIGWFASATNLLWSQGFQSRTARRTAALCAGSIIAVILLGGLRLALFPPAAPAVRIASISRGAVPPPPATAGVFHRIFAGQATPADLDALRAWSAANDNDLLGKAEREMQSGAKIVFWGEANAYVFADDEPALIARGQQLAAKYHAYLGMALGVLHTTPRPAMENKVVLIQPDGEISWQYNKAHPVPGAEASHIIRGDGKLRGLDTPYGHLSTVICFDGDSPQLLAQAGAFGTDIILDSANDWRAIDPWHTQMASFRGIEQGANLIRQTSGGLSAAYDYQGHRLSAMDHFQTSDYVMVSMVPTRGVHTIYSRLGDWFAWFSIATLVVLTVKLFRTEQP